MVSERYLILNKGVKATVLILVLVEDGFGVYGLKFDLEVLHLS